MNNFIICWHIWFILSFILPNFVEYIAIKCSLILKLSQMKSLRALIKLVYYLPEHDSLMTFARFYHIPFGGNYFFSILWKRVPPSKCLLVLMITSLCDISLEAEESLAISINSSILSIFHRVWKKEQTLGVFLSSWNKVFEVWVSFLPKS